VSYIDIPGFEEDKLFSDDTCGEMNPQELPRRVVDICDLNARNRRRLEVALGDDVIRPMMGSVRWAEGGSEWRYVL
jgi:hypothetical protein